MIINSIDSFPFTFTSNIIKSFLMEKNLLSGKNQFVDVNNFFKFIENTQN